MRCVLRHGTENDMVIRDKEKCRINSGMFGLFFEDINYGLDGGLHAEMIENRSFEFFDCGGYKYNWYKHFDGMYGWKGSIGAEMKIRGDMPLNRINPHYLEFAAKKGGEYFSNKAYDGIFMKAGAAYNVSFYAHTEDAAGRVRVEIRNGLNGKTYCCASTDIAKGEWKKYELVLSSEEEVTAGSFCIEAEIPGTYCFDFISMKPADAIYGVFRRDLADALKELKPGFLRFPGGCIVEGNTLDNMYKWKLSVGASETRKANWNRWAVHQNDGHGPFSHYNQTLGVGYYEYFMLCEYIGAKPLPVCNVGMACQYESIERFELEDEIFECFVRDALDLIEFANGPAESEWGGLRARMGHPEPFGLELIGIGNEQWETPESRFFERYTIFEKAIHEKYPDIRLIGSAGPDVTSDHYRDAWEFYRDAEKKHVQGTPEFAYAIDEHYYVGPDWMIDNIGFYDDYPRNIGVFAGEYAAHVGKESKTPERNCMGAAVAEAAFMTGLERNADVVKLASYAPLFARDGYVQWAPDMIWFNDTTVCRTPNYYVQQIFSCGTGDTELEIEGIEELRAQGVYASASKDSATGRIYIKLVNTGSTGQKISLLTEGGKAFAKARITSLSGEFSAYNSVKNTDVVVPEVSDTDLASGSITLKETSVNLIEIF